MMNEECQNHLKQARINEGLVLHLKDQCCNKIFYKWIFVAAFHSALHYFCAFCASRGDGVPDFHKDKNESERGGIRQAEETFWIQKDPIPEAIAVGTDYGQLFRWSNKVRYKPKEATLLSRQNIAKALSILNKCKLITLIETEYIVKRNRNYLFLKKASTDYILSLYKKIQANLD